MCRGKAYEIAQSYRMQLLVERWEQKDERISKAERHGQYLALDGITIPTD